MQAASGESDNKLTSVNSAALIAAAGQVQATLAPELERHIRDGFGAGVDGKDRFDTVVGLIGRCMC